MPPGKKRRLLLVDGYNVLVAWRGSGMSANQLSHSRDELIEMLCDYAGYTGEEVVVVFDAWRSDRAQRTSESRGPLSVVFTQRGETADQCIERMSDGYARAIDLERMELRVATSDNVEQTVVMGRGAIRLSARELLEEIQRTRFASQRQSETKSRSVKRDTLLDRLPADVKEKLEKMRRK